MEERMTEGRRKMFATLTVAVMVGGQLVSPHAYAANDQQGTGDQGDASHGRGAHHRTATPIKHVIVLIGENRTFDNVYATYVPKHGSVWNLLSRGIIKADGSPGPHADLARQFQ